jgi:hypothetical protein
MIDECEDPRWNDIDREESKNSKKKPVSMPLCPPQIPHGLIRARTRASANNEFARHVIFSIYVLLSLRYS